MCGRVYAARVRLKVMVVLQALVAAFLVGGAVVVSVVQPSGWARTAVVDLVLAAVIVASAVLQSRRNLPR